MSLGLTVVGALTTLSLLYIGSGAWNYPVAGIAAGITGAVLVWLRREALAVNLVGFAIVAIVVAADLALNNPIDRASGFMVMPILVVAVAFTNGAFAGRIFVALTVLALAVSAIDESLDGQTNNAIVRFVLDGSFVAFAGVLALGILKNREEARHALEDALDDIEQVVDIAAEVAHGDLSRDVQGEDGIAVAIRQMQMRLRSMVDEVQVGTAVLGPASAKIASSARQNEALAREQANAIGAVVSELQELTSKAAGISETSGSVITNAAAVQATNQRMILLFRNVRDMFQRIEGLLADIQEVSRKSEILALNAALEGHRAGQAGAGFSLVAGEMQQLSERTARASDDVALIVVGLQEFNDEAREAFGEMQANAELNQQLSRKISQSSGDQQRATQQLVSLMGELENSGRELASSAQQTILLAADLAELSGRLDGAVEDFTV